MHKKDTLKRESSNCVDFIASDILNMEEDAKMVVARRASLCSNYSLPKPNC